MVCYGIFWSGQLDSGFPQKLFVRYEEGFFEITRFQPELSGNFKIFWFTAK